MTSDDYKFEINFNKLEQELNNAVIKEQRYWTENDAKIRAVNQKIGSYDEFKDIVAASHLKPLDKGESVTEIDTKRQPWNTIVGRGEAPVGLDVLNAKQNNKSEIKIPFEKKPTTKPKSVQEFMRYWRLQLTAEDRFQYLIWIGLDHLDTLFRPDLGFGLLGDFLACYYEIVSLLNEGKDIALIEDAGIDDKDSYAINFVLNSLYIFARTNRFSLALQFLSSSEKKLRTDLFVSLKEKVGNDTREMFDKLVNDYDVTIIS